MTIAFLGIGRKSDEDMNESGTVTYTDKIIKVGASFPPEQDRERLSKYKRMKTLYDGKAAEIYERVTSILKDTPHAPQLEKLYIAVNIADPIITKVPDLLVGEPPIFDSGLADDTPQQDAINGYVEENDLVKLIHESALSNGYRGDAWIKVRYDYRQDYSALAELGMGVPEDAEMEPIIEHVTADCVFPEIANGNVKAFKAVNIASIEWIVGKKEDVPYLNVERHLPGYIVYERYKMSSGIGSIDSTYGYPLQTFNIVEKVATGRDIDVVDTGVPTILVHHIPYKSVDDAWQGKGTLEAIESLLIAINDRICAVDYILMKHSDPNSYGPDLNTVGGQVRMGGVYIPVTKDDVTPGYMTWDGQLTSAFKELETLIAMVFQIAETPQWLFGTVLGGNDGGTGTSHTDGAAIRARFLPILSKVNRVKTHYDRAIRDALYNCQLLDIAHGGQKFEAVYPTITWLDGLPKNLKEEAEVMQIRTGNKPTLDIHTAIKRMDNIDDLQADEIVKRIDSDTEKEIGTVDSSIFNEDVSSSAE